MYNICKPIFKKFQIIEIKLKSDSKLDGLKIMDIRNKFKARFLISAVCRGEEAYIPDGNFVLKSGDRICISATTSEIVRLMKEIGIQQQPAKKIMVKTARGARINITLLTSFMNHKSTSYTITPSTIVRSCIFIAPSETLSAMQRPIPLRKKAISSSSKLILLVMLF